MKLGLTAAALVATSCLCAAGKTRPEPSRPRSYAIINARLSTVSGPQIDGGTILIQNGLISAVSQATSVPPEAWVIDGEGLTVYPGFIHCLSTLGLPSAGGRKEPPQLSEGPEDRPATTPWRVAADHFQATERDLEKWRNAGFTSVVVAPPTGIFPGQASILNLGRASVAKLTVESRAALLVRYPEGHPGMSRAEIIGTLGYRGYPSSLLGRVSYVKQVLIDARHHDLARSVYDKDPEGLERPEYDRAIRPLAAALRKNSPVLYPANTSVELRRALRTISTLVPQVVLYGAQQAYGAAGDLSRSGTAVLVDLSWPEPAKDPDPEEDVSLRQLRFRDRAPTSPAALAEKGVRFGFYTSRSGGAADFLAGVRKAIQRGLKPADAIRTLTLGAARIYGVADRLGSLQAGKIANLVVFEGDPFSEKARPKMVFVDGYKFDVPELPKKGQTKERKK